MIDAALPDWIPINEAFKIAISRFGNRQTANDALLAALREGKIRNGGIMEDWSDRIVYKNIHLLTDDFMRWIKTAMPVRFS